MQYQLKMQKFKLEQHTFEYKKKLDIFYYIVHLLEQLFKTVPGNIIAIEHDKKVTPEIALIKFCGNSYRINLETSQSNPKQASILFARIKKENEYEIGKIDIVDDMGGIQFPSGKKIDFFEKDEFEEEVFSFFFSSIEQVAR